MTQVSITLSDHRVADIAKIIVTSVEIELLKAKVDQATIDQVTAELITSLPVYFKHIEITGE